MCDVRRHSKDLVEKTSPNAHTVYQDMEIFRQMSFELPVMLASLCEDYFACCSIDTAQVYIVRAHPAIVSHLLLKM